MKRFSIFNFQFSIFNLRAAGAGLLALGFGIFLAASFAFAGLCAVDPGHGVATAPVAHDDGIVTVCGACANAAAGAELPGRRQVTIGGRPVAFDDVAATTSRG